LDEFEYSGTKRRMGKTGEEIIQTREKEEQDKKGGELERNRKRKMNWITKRKI
jgi:hypothetical protein